MHRTRLATLLLVPVALTSCTAPAATLSATQATPTTRDARVAVVFTGGHATDPRDHGRPVVLIAAALGVPTAVFRTAFSGVSPAAAGEQPQAEQVTRNKAALLNVLGAYGVTNERLDEVSDYYRYDAGTGGSWPARTTKAVATVRAGRVVSVTVTDAGAGYSSAPTATVPGATGSVAVTLAFGRDLRTNGSVRTVG